VLFVCRLRVAPNEPRQAKMAPDGSQTGSDSPKWPQRSPRYKKQMLFNEYRYAYSITCKIRIELLLPIYMSRSQHSLQQVKRDSSKDRVV